MWRLIREDGCLGRDIARHLVSDASRGYTLVSLMAENSLLFTFSDQVYQLDS